jgi:hypothetical protein
MKNLVRFAGNPFDIYTAAVSRKEEGTDRQHLENQSAAIQIRYTEYDALGAQNNLEILQASNYDAAVKKALIKLYDFDSLTLRNLREEIALLQSREIGVVCQYCTFGQIESLDHIVPKDEFAEFAVHPHNLIPCCQKCNGKKSDVWRPGGVKRFLNLYLDILPNERFLFVNITNDPVTGFGFDFYLRYPAGVPLDTWQLIRSHIHYLNLLARWEDKAIAEITNTINSAVAYIRVGRLSQAQVTEAIRETAARNRVTFGPNYWKSAMEDVIVNNTSFWDCVNAELNR